MNKQTRLAILLCAFVIFTYPMIIRYFYPPSEQSAGEFEVEPARTARIAALVDSDDVTRALRGPQSARIVVESDQYTGTFDISSGGLDELVLRFFRESETGEPTPLIRPNPVEPAVLAIQDLSAGELGESEPPNVTHTSTETVVVLRQRNDSGLVVAKRIAFQHEGYMIDIRLDFSNPTDVAIENVAFTLVGPTVLRAESGGSKSRTKYEQPKAKIDGKIIKQKASRRAGFLAEEFGDTEWLAYEGQYFSIILVPETPSAGAIFRSDVDKGLWMGLLERDIAIPPHGLISKHYRMYAGPNDESILALHGDQFTEVIDYGMFSAIVRILLSALVWLGGVLGSYGWAIIILSGSVSLALYPITTKKSMDSARRMQEIQPEMQELKKKYKDDPQKQQAEMMALYKKHKINPLGGCLPMLLQMPIFIAFWRGLSRFVGLKGSKFLWINDLSLSDHTLRLPVELPLLGAWLNVLPLVMGVLMFLQQRQTMGAHSGPQQKQMMYMMPIMFTALFYQFPAGLVLYWLTNSAVSIAMSKKRRAPSIQTA